MMWIVCSSRSRCTMIDHARGTVYATTIIMRVMMTIRAARVNPRSLLRIVLVRCSIEAVPRRGAANVDDARRGGGLVAGSVDSGGIVRIGRSLHFFPVAALRDRIFRS